ncbi:Unknown protein, partial [Striga hermonthica]
RTGLSSTPGNPLGRRLKCVRGWLLLCVREVVESGARSRVPAMCGRAGQCVRRRARSRARLTWAWLGIDILDRKRWQRQDQLLASWFSLSESILISVIGLNSSNEIWKALEASFSTRSKARTMHYRIQLQNLKKGNLNIKEYVNKIKVCCDTLAAGGHVITEQDQIMHILIGVSSEYDAVVVSVNARVETLTLVDVMALLLTYESRLEAAAIATENTILPSANIASQNNKPQQNFSNQRERGGYRGKERGARGRGGRFPQNRVQCHICGYTNHTADKCYNRFNSDFVPSNTNQRGFNDNRSIGQSSAMYATGSNQSESDWFPDSGATHHITNDFSNLSVASDYTGNNKLQIGNGSGLDISHVGKTLFTNSHHTFKLNNLLHVPEIAKNLINYPCSSRFGIFHRRKNALVLAHRRDRFGVAQFAKDNNNSLKKLSYFVSSVKDLELWHRRLGHPSFDVTKKALDICNLPYANNKITLCADCLQAKSHVLPFPTVVHNTEKPLEFIHTDLWGPAPIKSTSGACYYVAFVDDYTKFTWLYFLKQKSETYKAFVHFQNVVENQLNLKIKTIQSDGGTEFKPLSSLFSEKGIHHRISCPYTPQQNGLVERKHRQVIEVSLSMMSASNIPKRFWEQAFSTAIYLINRIPNKTISYQSPYHRLYGQIPNYRHLKVFGCRCFPHLRPYTKDKLDLRSTPGVFLGYRSQYKGYKVLLKNKIIISRNVVFDELCFPYKETDNLRHIEQHYDVSDFSIPPPLHANEPVIQIPTHTAPQNDLHSTAHASQNTSPLHSPVHSPHHSHHTPSSSSPHLQNIMPNME